MLWTLIDPAGKTDFGWVDWVVALMEFQFANSRHVQSSENAHGVCENECVCEAHECFGYSCGSFRGNVSAQCSVYNIIY